MEAVPLVMGPLVLETAFILEVCTVELSRQLAEGRKKRLDEAWYISNYPTLRSAMPTSIVGKA